MPVSREQPVKNKFPRKTPPADLGKSPSELIDARIASLEDWRGTLLAQLRAIIRSADPEILEEWKWNVPVWASNGIICTGEVYKHTVKLTFAKGALFADPSKLFNSSLDGNVRRAIDFKEGSVVDGEALGVLIREAAAYNRSQKPPTSKVNR